MNYYVCLVNIRVVCPITETMFVYCSNDTNDYHLSFECLSCEVGGEDEEEEERISHRTSVEMTN